MPNVIHSLFFQYAEIINGNVTEHPNPAVPSSLLAEIWKWKQEGESIDDVVVRLHQRTVPLGYEIHTWKPGV